MLTGGELSLRAIFGCDVDRHRAVDLCLRASDPDLDVAVRGRYGAGHFAQPSKPRCYPYAAVSRLCWWTPRTYQIRSLVGVLLQPCTGVPHPQHSPKVS
jgi:hypothetical protein